MQSPRNRAGFTLLEVMIVVVILGILASTVLPQFSYTQESAMESSLVTSLNTLRTQIQLYKMQHNGTLPSATLLELTIKTNSTGGTTGNTVYGPYIIGSIPINPFTGYNAIASGTDTPVPDNSLVSGWRYNTATGLIKPCYKDSSVTPSGKNFDDL